MNVDKEYIEKLADNTLINQYWDMFDISGKVLNMGYARLVGEDGEDHLEIAYIDDPTLAHKWAHDTIMLKKAEEVIFGLDRFTKPDQGTEFDDVYTVLYWSRFNPWCYGVIDYSPSQNIKRPINWHNEHWIEALHNEHKRWAAANLPMTITLKTANGKIDLLGLEGLREPSKQATESKA
jgi:hypothetical protein